MGNLSRPNNRVAPKGLPPGKRPPRGISFELICYVIALHCNTFEPFIVYLLGMPPGTAVRPPRGKLFRICHHYIAMPDVM